MKKMMTKENKEKEEKMPEKKCFKCEQTENLEKCFSCSRLCCKKHRWDYRPEFICYICHPDEGAKGWSSNLSLPGVR